MYWIPKTVEGWHELIRIHAPAIETIEKARDWLRQGGRPYSRENAILDQALQERLALRYDA